MADAPVVIVGGGLAGAKTAETLREDGFPDPVVLVCAEPHRPYERPALSKGYLLGSEERDSVFVHPTEWYAERGVDLRLSTPVSAIDRESRTVLLADGDRLPYRDLVLATGSRPRRLDVPGAELEGVHYLRRIEDSDRLLAALRGPARRVAVVGGGWIGLETAAAARSAGHEVTLLEQGPLPLGRVLGPEMATVFADLHRQHGVDVRTEVSVAELTGSEGRVDGVRLGDGTRLAADVVIVGIGILPETELAREAGLEVATGVIVDEHLRTADPHVLAAGDVAESWRPTLGRRLRVEHWSNALRHGEIAGRTLLGIPASDDRLPYFYTDQYDLGMEYVGHVEPGGYDDVVVRGDLAAHEFIAFWVREGRVLAGMNVNVWDVTERIEEVIRAGGGVDDGDWPVG
jgi:3-phenylpropionate/trans-cinnamate dioxygenase ferredoxin reductase subunit